MKNTQLSFQLYKITEGGKCLFLIFLSLIFLVQLVRSLHWELTTDAAFLHYVAYLINEHDFVPYRDIFEINMPGAYLFHMAVGKMFGYSDMAFQIINIIWLAATLTVTWFIMVPIGRCTAFTSSLLFGIVYLGYGPYMSLQRDAIALLPVATALLLAIRPHANIPINITHFLLGGLFAFATLIKPHMAIGLPVVIIYTYYIAQNSNAKSVKTFIRHCIVKGIFAFAGFLLIMIIPFLWLWKIGALESFFDIYFSYTPLYAKVTKYAQVLNTYDHIKYLFTLYIQFDGCKISPVASMYGLYLVLKNCTCTAIQKQALLLFSLAILYSFCTFVSGKFFNYHWIPYLYFACLCTAMIFSSSQQERKKKTIFPFFIFVLAVITMYPVRLTVKQVFFDYQKSAAFTINFTKPKAEEIARYLNKHLSPTDKVQTLDWISGSQHGMLLSRSVTATPYITDFQFYSHISNNYIRNLRIDFIKKLREEMPKYIIEAHNKPISRLDASYGFTELNEFIKKYYQKECTINDFDILRKKDDY